MTKNRGTVHSSTKAALLMAVSAATLSLAAPPASASEYHPYVSLFGGASLLTQNPHIPETVGSISFDPLMNNPAYLFGGAVGVEWNKQFRAELELSHAAWTSKQFSVRSPIGRVGNKRTFGTTFNTGASDMSATYLLGNLWLDLSHDSIITPYVGGGFGIGWANVNALTASNNLRFSSSGAAIQLGGGLRFNASRHVAIDVGYRFKDLIGLNYGAIAPFVLSNTSLASHNFQIGLTYQF